jgi:hypothetical protein
MLPMFRQNPSGCINKTKPRGASLKKKAGSGGSKSTSGLITLRN